ncbi:pyridoxal-phosphate dependent enzyme, partial [Mesotoga sp.]
CRYTKAHDGLFLSVSDSQILRGIIELARETGVFAEPAGAAAFAGFRKAREIGIVDERSRILVVVTGNGLKDLKNVSAVLPEVKTLPPEKDVIEEALR